MLSAFPKFSAISDILLYKCYQDVPLPEVPVSIRRLRKHTSGKLVNDLNFLDDRLRVYGGYLEKLLFYIDQRFKCDTFEICLNMGKLFNIHNLLFPSTGILSTMNPLNIESKEDLFGLLDNLPFSDKVDRQTLYVQYTTFIELIKKEIKDIKSAGLFFNKCRDPVVKILKKFVNLQPECLDLIKLLSLCISFPVSEAVVESWGSTISHLFSNKHSPKEPINDVTNTGTIDKLAFLKLNGPPPGMLKNRDLFKKSLEVHYKGDYSSHFINRTGINTLTSKVVHRILEPPAEKIFPCFN